LVPNFPQLWTFSEIAHTVYSDRKHVTKPQSCIVYYKVLLSRNWFYFVLYTSISVGEIRKENVTIFVQKWINWRCSKYNTR
jgi:hypothetical protein